MLPYRDIPFETQSSDKRGYELFREAIWRSRQVCNSCFSQVRDVGPEHTRMLDVSGPRRLEHGIPLEMTINEWYQRTDNGSQEHSPGDYNLRFGTCYCLNCGTDCNGEHRNTSLEDMIPLVDSIFRYTKTETPHEINGSKFGREVRELKSIPDATGYETEIMAIAFGRAVEPDLGNGTDSATSRGSEYANAGASAD